MTDQLKAVDPTELAELVLQPLRDEAKRLDGVRREGAEARFVAGAAADAFAYVTEVMEKHGVVFARKIE